MLIFARYTHSTDSEPRASACLFHSERFSLALIDQHLLGSESNPYIYMSNAASVQRGRFCSAMYRRRFSQLSLGSPTLEHTRDAEMKLITYCLSLFLFFSFLEKEAAVRSRVFRRCEDFRWLIDLDAAVNI